LGNIEEPSEKRDTQIANARLAKLSVWRSLAMYNQAQTLEADYVICGYAHEFI
jgi:hypothetical protein